MRLKSEAPRQRRGGGGVRVERWRGKGGAVAGEGWSGGRGWRRCTVVVETAAAWLEKAASGVAPSIDSVGF